MHREIIKTLEEAINQVKELENRETNFWEYEVEYYLKNDTNKTPLKIFTLGSLFVDLRGVKDIEKRICGDIDAVKEEVVKIY